MSHSLLEQVIRGDGPPLVPLTTEQYHRLTESGVLPEGLPVELIDGFLVYKDRADARSTSPMNQGPHHAFVVDELLQAVQSQVASAGLRARCQLPIHLPPCHEPEPDVSVIAGPASQYTDRLPEAADTWAVFEVAHSSRIFDRETKQRTYADAAIPVFVLVDLVDETIEVYTDPVAAKGHYHRCEKFGRGEKAAIDLRGVRVELDVDAILP